VKIRPEAMGSVAIHDMHGHPPVLKTWQPTRKSEHIAKPAVSRARVINHVIANKQ